MFKIGDTIQINKKKFLNFYKDDTSVNISTLTEWFDRNFVHFNKVRVFTVYNDGFIDIKSLRNGRIFYRVPKSWFNLYLGKNFEYLKNYV